MSTVDDVPSLTPNQVLVLVTLMSEARELSNNDLKELAGFALTGADNAKLEKKLGLVETDRTHRPFSHQLTDRGWALVRVLHTGQPPKQGGSASRTLFTLLRNIHQGLEQLQTTHGVKLSPGEFFQQQAPTDVESVVRDAYTALAPRPGEWVGLADLRETLTGLSRTQVDEALMSLLDQDGVRIIPAANTKALKRRDHDAAIRIGGEENHAIAIGQP